MTSDAETKRWFKVVTDSDSGPIAHSAAQETFAHEFGEARAAYIEVLGVLGGPWIRDLLLSGKTFYRKDVRNIKDHIDELSRRVHALSAHMDAAVDVVDRAVPDAEGRD